jgi:hypothetical protein
MSETAKDVQPDITELDSALQAGAGAAQGAFLADRPHLQGFGPGTGPFEVDLPPTGSVTLGRSPHADVHLPHHSVSRIHATITRHDDQYVLEDANSSFGTTVNGAKVETHTLRHGDSIQITLYVLQFRTHSALPGAAAAAAQAKWLLRSEFCQLPSTMRLRHRTLQVAPQEVFRPGDTLRIGRGGLLIPTFAPPPDGISLELRLFWPNNQNKRYLGEIVGVIKGEANDWLCVKLHSVPKETHRVVVAAAQHGEWIDVAQT